MGDVAVHQFPITWRIQPPLVIEIGTLFTVVAKINSRVEPQIIEAFLVDPSGEIPERFYGNYEHTGPGFDNDGMESTYIWFNMHSRLRGKQKFQFRISWRFGHHLYGESETFEIRVRKRCPPPFYCTDDQDLLALLEPDIYDPTPIEMMIENV
ncbi:hypothetical protein GGS24DRAFT_503713 [Hypoxylon argillaceum]|nr:hypothetical protein GGS24DRAFT_503713 [Hypoxylon argillaceum]